MCSPRVTHRGRGVELMENRNSAMESEQWLPAPCFLRANDSPDIEIILGESASWSQCKERKNKGEEMRTLLLAYTAELFYGAASLMLLSYTSLM